MFSIANLNFDRLLPHIPLGDILRRYLVMHQNYIDADKMPESWRRDIGLLDGRDRRGPSEEGAFRAARMVYTQRSL